MNLPKALVALFLFAASAAYAQPYPSRPITLVVSFAAGSGTDSVARIVAQKLSERLKQPVVVENKAGANGQIAAEYVKNAKPDGYTLWMTTNTTQSANPSLYKELRYDPVKDFTPIVLTGELPFALVVNNDLPAKTLADFVAYAKANPGKISYATPNSTSLVGSETLKIAGKLEIVGVPYKASPQALGDVASGQVQVMFPDLPQALTQVQAGKVRGLGVTGPQRTKVAPDLPAIAETVKGYSLVYWLAVFAPAATPKPIQQKLFEAVAEAMKDPATVQAMTQGRMEAAVIGLDDFATYVKTETKWWTDQIKAAGIEPE